MSRRRSSSQPFSLFAFQDIIMATTAIVILVTMIMTIELVNRANQLPKDASTVNIEAVDQIQKSNHDLESEIQSLSVQIENSKSKVTLGPPVTQEDADELKRQARVLEQQITDLQDQLNRPAEDFPDNQSVADRLAKLQKKLNQLIAESSVIYKPSTTANRTAWIIVCNADNFEIRNLSESTRSTRLEDNDREQRMKALTNQLNRHDPQSDYFLIVLRPSATDHYFDLLQAFDQAGISTGADLIDEEVKVMTAADIGAIQ